jgi:hypothetical protein
MAWSDDILGIGVDGTKDAKVHAAAMDRLSALPMQALLRGWDELNRASLRDRSAGMDLFNRYFDGVGASDPGRACNFVIAEAEFESDDELVALIPREKLLLQLLHRHAARIAHRLEAEALRLSRLRWVLGGIAWAIDGLIEDEHAKALLLPVADRRAWDAWSAKTRSSTAPDFENMPVAELARSWIEIMPRSPIERERDDGFHTLFDYQCKLVAEDPERALTLVTEVLRLETHERVLSVLAAGLLEDLICAEREDVIAAVEREAGGTNASAGCSAASGIRASLRKPRGA